MIYIFINPSVKMVNQKKENISKYWFPIIWKRGELSIVYYQKVSLEELTKMGKFISENLFPGAKILLFGDLGTGKTTIASLIINGLANKEIVVTSPTFSLIKVYDTKPTVYHIDLYRLNDVSEIEYLDIFFWPHRSIYNRMGR